ncbi:MAG: GNAT family N-acetyltransferase [Wenzhouxiangellaceae bacterium]
MDLKLRGFLSGDTRDLLELANDECVSSYLADTFPYPYTAADANWWITTGCQAEGQNCLAIEYQGRLAGGVGVTAQSGWRSHIGEIGYWLGQPFWGRGVATEAVRQMTELAFSEDGYLKLVAPVLAPNIASMRVLEKNGYVCEGILRREVSKRGNLYDIHRYARNCSAVQVSSPK